jgi:hypothetical protein
MLEPTQRKGLDWRGGPPALGAHARDVRDDRGKLFWSDTERLTLIALLKQIPVSPGRSER